MRRHGRAYSGRPVTFNFQDVPVRTVLQLIAEESDLNIVVADTVAGNVTLRLVNVPWDQALDIVLRPRAWTSAARQRGLGRAAGRNRRVRAGTRKTRASRSRTAPSWSPSTSRSTTATPSDIC